MHKADVIILFDGAEPMMLRPVSAGAQQWAQEAFKGRPLHGTPLGYSLQGLDANDVVDALSMRGLRVEGF